MVRLFGSPGLASGAEPSFRLPPKAYVALATLPLRFGSKVYRRTLAAMLWEDASAERAQGSLRSVLKLIRRAGEAGFGPLAKADVASVWRDELCLVSDLEMFLAITTVEDAAGLKRLSALYRGELLAGVHGLGSDLDEWVQAQRARMKERFITLSIEGAQRVAPGPAEAVLGRLSADYSDDESVLRAMLIHQARAYSAARVRRTYEEFRERLARTLEIEPEIETRILAAQLGAATAQGGNPVMAARPHAYPVRPASVTQSIPRLLLLPPVRGPYRFPRVQLMLAASLLDDVMITLTRLRSFAVFAPYSARQLAASQSATAWAPYQVDYVVNTRLLPGDGGTLRLAVSLVRTSTDEVLIGDELRFSSEDLPSRHADLVGSLAGRLVNQIERAELATFRTTGAASAYTHYLLGTEQLKIIELENLRKARKHFRRATDLAPDFAPAIGMTARSLTLEWLVLGRQETDLLREATRLATRAVEIDALDANGHRELGHAAIYLQDLDASLSHLEDAQARAPHHADILANVADANVHNSTNRRARTLMREAISLNPLPPDEYFWIGATADFFLGDYTDALATLGRMKKPDAAGRLFAACAAMTGDLKAARGYRDAIMARQPDFRLEDWAKLIKVRAPEDRERYVEALRLAGFS